MAAKTSRSERIQAIAQTILEAFRTGEVPKALAQVFINTAPKDSPMAKWSWRNRLLVALRGERDARGFRQWKQVDRKVVKGARAFHILGPMVRTVEETDEESGESQEMQIVTGFVPIPVFGLSQTEGEPVADPTRDFIEALPVIEVARAWQIEVSTAPFSPRTQQLGSFQPGRITLSVENLSTWMHELCHAADDRLGTRLPSPRSQREVVAELGGAVLLECLGYEVESDRGGAWSYIQAQADTPAEAFRLCGELLDRTCTAVSLILETAQELDLIRQLEAASREIQLEPPAAATPTARSEAEPAQTLPLFPAA